MMSDLTPSQHGLLAQQIESLKAERFANHMNTVRWRAIPEDLRDGTEVEGISQAEHAIKVLDAQIAALQALSPDAKQGLS